MSGLPVGWAEARLDELADVRLGRQRSPKNHAGARMRPYLRAANVTWRGLDLTDVKEMNFSEQESAVYELRAGDVLVAEASGSPGEVGKPALWRGEIDGCCFQNTLVRIRSCGPRPDYLRYFLLGEARSGRLGDAAPGVGIHHIGATRLSAWNVPVPPLNEQRRIVAAIEEQFSRLDAANASLDTAFRRTIKFREGVLAEAFGESSPARRVGEVASLSDGPFGSNLKTAHYVENGPRVVRLQNIGDGVFRDERAHITEEHFNRLAKHVVVPGDIVAASLGDKTPRACLVPPGLGPAIVKADCIRIRPIAEVDPKYLMWALNSRPVRVQAAARIKGIGRPRLGLSGIRDLVVPVPPHEKQVRIAAEVEQRLSVADAMHHSIETARRRSAALRRAILERAFRGELVPQDPSDEPASFLLERIAAERATAEGATGHRPHRRAVQTGKLT